MNRSRKFIINGIILTLTTLLIKSVGFIFNIYIAKKVGSETTGIFGLVMSVYLFAITFATSGLSLACTYIVSEKFAIKDYTCAIKTVKTCFIYASILGILGMLVLILFANPISKFFFKSQINPAPILSMSFGLPLIAISSVISGFFTAIGKPFRNSISQIVEFLVKMLSTIFLLKYFFTKDLSTICSLLIIADVISEIASFVLNIIYYYIERTKIVFSNKCLSDYKKEILKISFPVAITSYIRSGLSSFKQFLIPISLEKYGMSYAIALSNYGTINGMVMPILLFLSVFVNSFASLLVPEFSRLLAGNNVKRMKFVCENIFQKAYCFSIGIGACLFFFSSEISYMIYQNLNCDFWIKILSPLVFFMYIDTIIDNLLKGVNESFKVMCCNILDLVSTIAILYFLVPIFGMKGYIFSIYFSEILNFTISSYQLRKKIKFDFSFKNYMLLPIFASILSFFITSILKFSFENFIWYSIFKIILFFVIYIFVLFIILKLKSNFLLNVLYFRKFKKHT